MTQQPWGQQPQQFPQQGQPQPGYAPVQQPGQPQGWQQPQQPQQPQGWPAQQQAPAQNPWGGQQAPAQQEVAAPIETGDSFDDFFSGTGEKIPSFDFGATQNGGEKVIGSMLMGTIVDMAKMQQRDYADNGKLLYWEPRNETEQRRPKMQLAITLQTEFRNWQGVKPKLIPVDPATQQPYPPDHDDGKRRLYVKEYSDLNRAINIACDKAGQKPRKGGQLAVAVRGFEPTQKGNDKVLYDAQYKPAPEVAPTDSFFAQQPPAQAPQQAFQPQQQFAQGGYTGQPAPAVQPQGFPAQAPQQGFPQAAGPGAPQAVAGQDVPQQNPSTLGNNPAPTSPPEWATDPAQAYGGQPPAQAAPQYDAPPY